jgi:hypothetical protein
VIGRAQARSVALAAFVFAFLLVSPAVTAAEVASFEDCGPPRTSARRPIPPFGAMKSARSWSTIPRA